MTFDEFIASPVTNAWIEEDGLKVYVRKSIYKGLIDIANVNAAKRGKGAFTRFLVRLEEQGYALHIENVIADRFADYFRKLGWTEIPCQYGVPSFVNVEATRRELGPSRPNWIIQIAS